MKPVYYTIAIGTALAAVLAAAITSKDTSTAGAQSATTPSDVQGMAARPESKGKSQSEILEESRARRASVVLQSRLFPPFSNKVDTRVAEEIGMVLSEHQTLQETVSQIHQTLRIEQLKRLKVESRTNEELVLSVRAFPKETLIAEEQFWQATEKSINAQSYKLIRETGFAATLNCMGGGFHEVKYVFSKTENLPEFYDVLVCWKIPAENRATNYRILAIPRTTLTEWFGSLLLAGGWNFQG